MLRNKLLLLGVIGCAVLILPHSLNAQQSSANPASQPLKAVPVSETGIHASLGDVTDSRTTGKFFQYLRIEVKLGGEGLQTVFGTSKPVFTAAVDDTGRSLIKDEKKEEPLFWSLEPNKEKKTSLENNVDLLNPGRRATSISLLGYVDVLDPTQDPASIYTVKDLTSLAGKSLLPQEYAKYGLEITALTKALADKMKQEKAEADQKKTASPSMDQAMQQAFGKMFETLLSGFLRMGDNDILFIVKDPQHQIAFLEVTDENGIPIKTGGGRLMSQDKESGSTNYTIGYAAPLPPTAQLRVYFATPKSLLRIPFRFENIPLP